MSRRARARIGALPGGHIMTIGRRHPGARTEDRMKPEMNEI
jgi:hypothetical protein